MSKWILLLLIFPLLILVPKIYAISLDEVNQKVCNRFEEDTARLAGVMEELRRRKGITETRVAFGNVDTQIETADYWITYAAEAIAFQRSKQPQSEAGLRSQLQTLAGKVIRAKNEVRKALNE